jgi:hypothetical protein
MINILSGMPAVAAEDLIASSYEITGSD